ncbi:hypothetical protein [Myxococcus sp. AS-1-15]|uniref:hypothetical protein n=1 Tax=Myxococcus sp. AS-1-15 TaxID=2874600 RepID=UPI001CBCE66C|nr:hypothetical protein [Myxococcus sp. AS-1-15]MBZ4400386.1 hypothetical protein [Myxococcus sp. AS-1-15]
MSDVRQWSTLSPPVYAPPAPTEPRPAIFVRASGEGWRAVAYTVADEPVASAWSMTADGARYACDGYVTTYLAQVTR